MQKPINTYQFDYPENCNKCSAIDGCEIKTYLQQGTEKRLMLIGQDPTIKTNAERVKTVLMLDEENGQLRRWLEKLFGKDTFNSITVYATNLVKCTFNKPPSTYRCKNFLKPYFEHCKTHLIQEVKNYNPDVVFTFGEPKHRNFISLLDNNALSDKMNEVFTGDFYEVSIDGVVFKYTPSPHIQTFRVAETYGESVKSFKNAVLREFKS